ncbi:MAG: metallophosphoesterase family protein [Bacteroidetes bacterium]|nr:metallophosphoesterase family protein [Bacteroidota bacterium]
MLKYFAIGCLLFFFGNANAQTLLRGPYLTKATNSGITICWRTDIPCNSKVSYGLQYGLYLGGAVDNNLVHDHAIELQGLQSGTKYFYKIGTTTYSLQGNADNYFKTLPIASTTYNKPIRIWAVGDIAKATINQEKVRDAFLQFVDTNYVDGYLMLGDNAYPSGFDENFQHGFFDYFQNNITKHTVLWPALGNHEYDNDYNKRLSHHIPYYDIFHLPTQGESGGLASNTEMYYSFDIGNAHFINLDSYGLEQVGTNYFGISDTSLSPQIQWLKQDLAANILPWVIVSFHHPPYCMGTHNSDIEPDLAYIRQYVTPILERYNVDVVLNGHCHTYQRSQFIHQHVGNESSFDTLTHRIQNSSGYNDSSALACPYIKNSTPALPSDSGLLYLVIGSGSDYNVTPQLTWPHNAMYYSNYTDNGSLLLTIEGNKLEGLWLSTDTSEIVKDKFTIYKNVNRKKHITVAAGTSAALEASWQHTDDYNWSTGEHTQSISITPLINQVITVSNKQGCITDSFFITIAYPAIASNASSTTIRISPNPVQSKLHIHGLEPGTYTYRFLNLAGRKCIQHEIKVETNTQSIELSVESLSSNDYFLVIEKEGKSVFNQSVLVRH